MAAHPLSDTPLAAPNWPRIFVRLGVREVPFLDPRDALFLPRGGCCHCLDGRGLDALVFVRL